MGLFSHLIVLAVGFYGGSHMAKNYEINRMKEDFMRSECRKKIEEFLKEYKKPEQPHAHPCGCSHGSQ